MPKRSQIGPDLMASPLILARQRSSLLTFSSAFSHSLHSLAFATILFLYYVMRPILFCFILYFIFFYFILLFFAHLYIPFFYIFFISLLYFLLYFLLFVFVITILLSTNVLLLSVRRGLTP